MDHYHALRSSLAEAQLNWTIEELSSSPTTERLGPSILLPFLSHHGFQIVAGRMFGLYLQTAWIYSFHRHPFLPTYLSVM